MKIFVRLFLCCVQYQVLIAAITNLPHKQSKDCYDILDDFSQYASNFTRCAIYHARPVTLCEECIDHFIEFRDKYQELLHINVNGTLCQSLFVSQDRLNAVVEYHDNILAVWNKGNCNTCYDWVDDKPAISNNTKRFIKMHNDTEKCILENQNPYANNSQEVCEKCMQTYVNLDDFYKSLSTDSIGVDVICMDIVDKMNATRSKWSKDLNCCKLRQTPEILFLCCTGIISFLPFLFYFSLRYCGPMRDLPNVLRQSRIKQTILASINGKLQRSQ